MAMLIGSRAWMSTAATTTGTDPPVSPRFANTIPKANMPTNASRAIPTPSRNRGVRTPALGRAGGGSGSGNAITNLQLVEALTR